MQIRGIYLFCLPGLRKSCSGSPMPTPSAPRRSNFVRGSRDSDGFFQKKSRSAIDKGQKHVILGTCKSHYWGCSGFDRPGVGSVACRGRPLASLIIGQNNNCERRVCSGGLISRHVAPSRHNRRQAMSFMVLALDFFLPGPGEISDGIVRKVLLFAGGPTGR